MQGNSPQTAPSANKHQKIIAGLIVMLVLALAIIIVLATLLYRTTTSSHSKSTPQVTASIQLDKPNMSDIQIGNWAVNAIVSAYSYNYSNYHHVLNSLSQYFSADALTVYMQHLHASGNLESVIHRKLTVSAVPRGAPVISNQGLLDGKYSWQVRVPLLISFYNKNERFNANILAKMTIRRTSVDRYKDGLVVEKFTADKVH